MRQSASPGPAPDSFVGRDAWSQPRVPRTSVVSIHRDEGVCYPPADDYFSPSEAHTEYRWSHLSKRPNRVYTAVRSCLADARLDAARFETSAWNPLGCYIRRGDRVFVLCNFVKHNDQGHSASRFFAKCTHGSVLRAVLDYILLALEGTGSVAFGNAPIQSCDWSRVQEETGARRVEEFYTKHASQPVPALDLRRHVVRYGTFGLEIQLHEDSDDCVEVDLGAASLLESLYQGGQRPQLRVLDYDPRRTERCHAPGKHIYILHRRILESDVIVSIPKLKTHEKVGITSGIKGSVGAVAHKDCLAHHRRGPPKAHGDEYPDRMGFLAPLSWVHDFVNTRPPGVARTVAHTCDIYSRKVIRRFTRALGGSWSGNDTCWRMAVDLARILRFCGPDGVMTSQPQRQHIMFTDGIIAGEGNGPLSPMPVSLGYVAFADNVAAGDYVNCLAMGFDPSRLPLIQAALQNHQYPLADGLPDSWELNTNGRPVTCTDLQRLFPRQFAPPREWRQLLAHVAAH